MPTKAWRIANREKFLAQQRRQNARTGEYRRDWQLRRRYGISAEEYDRMLDRQAGRCAICGDDAAGRRLHVDHDHETGRVRGLLCMTCNTALAHLENESWRTAADAYLDD